jgi:hypothetical protein
MPGDVSNAVIASLAKRPDVTTGTSGIAGLMRGISSGIATAEGWQAKRKEKAERDAFEESEGARPPGPEPTDMEMGKGVAGKLGGFAGAFLRGPAVEAQAADPFFGLKQKLFQQKVAMTELKVDEAVRSRDELIKNEGLFRDFSTVLDSSLKDGTATSVESLISVQNWLGQNPSLLNDPRTSEQLKLWHAGRKLQEEAKRQSLALDVEREARSLGLEETIKISEDGGVTRQFQQPDSLAAQRVAISQQNLAARMQEISLARDRLAAQMAPEQREKLRAGLQAIARDPLIIDSAEKLQKMDAFIKRFEAQGGAVHNPANVADPLGLFE